MFCGNFFWYIYTSILQVHIYICSLSPEYKYRKIHIFYGYLIIGANSHTLRKLSYLI